MEEDAVEKQLEARGLVDSEAEGDGLYDRYLLALGLLIVTIITFAWSGDSEWGRLLSVAVEGATLIVILRSSRVHRRILTAGIAVVAICLVGAIISESADGVGDAGPAILGALLAVVGPPAIIRRLLTHRTIDLTTVAGALCVYLLAGIFFAYLYGAITDVDNTPFFAQGAHATGVDYVYFSFVTLATLGYGDLTPKGDLGRMLAVTEAVLGQLYLVSAVALLVGNLGRPRVSREQMGRRPAK